MANDSAPQGGKTSAREKMPVPEGTPARAIRDLPGLGPRSEEMFAQIGIFTAEDFLGLDPYEAYARLKAVIPGLNMVAVYAILGAQEGRHWLEIKRERRMEILLRLEEMGLAPRKGGRKKGAESGDGREA